MFGDAGDGMSYIEIYGCDSVERREELAGTVRVTTLEVARRFWEHSRLYGPDGVVWRPVPATPEDVVLSGLARFLAFTGYNPWRTVPMRYEHTGEYKLPELKRRIWECVERDDDILTQFMEADEIKVALEKATDFERVAALVRRMGEEQDTAEQAEAADERQV